MIYALIAVIVLQLGLIAYIVDRNEKLQKFLINRIIAKNNQEAVNLDLADKTEIRAESPPPSEFEGLNMKDLMETSEPTDEEYERIVKRSNA